MYKINKVFLIVVLLALFITGDVETKLHNYRWLLRGALR